MADAAPSPEQVRAAVDEILGWPGISRSPQIAELLRYVVDKVLAGDGPSIKAYSIAVDVLGRPQSFDPQADPIVRVQARRLRTLLEQFYASGVPRSGVRIDLPLGRYVPEFRLLVPGSVPDAKAAQIARRPFWLDVLLGLGVTLVALGIAVTAIRWFGPDPAIQIPPQPAVSVGNFDNLTGEPGLDDAIARVPETLANALARFDTLTVVRDGAPLVVRGTVAENAGTFSLKVLLVKGPNILWSTTIEAPARAGEFGDAVDRVAAQIGNATGPLFATDRAWLGKLDTAPSPPTLYLCQLEYMQWRDSRNPGDADRASSCFDTVLAVTPDSASALAASAGVDAWRESFRTRPGADLVAALADETTKAARAIALAPGDSFVHEQQGLVLGRQGSLDAARAALTKAMELNRSNVDAVAVAGIVTWLSGDFASGSKLAETALTSLSTPPPWYYMARAFEAMQQKQYFDALEAGLALAVGDEEFGPAIVLAAAPQAGRSDLVDRYRPMVMGNPRFQQTGILPRLALLIKPPVLIERLREGLTLAGIPPAALVGPFVADTPANR